MNPLSRHANWTTGPSIVALGGGHGLAASLRALRRITDSVTAVVGVSDDGAHLDASAASWDSSRRVTFGWPWPRCVVTTRGADVVAGVAAPFRGKRRTGRTRGRKPLDLRVVGRDRRPVAGLDWVAALLEAQGRVLPVACEPVDLIAQVRGIDGDDAVTTLRGQVDIATTDGEVLSPAYRTRSTHPLPAGDRGDRQRRDGCARPRELVHLGAAASVRQTGA